MTQSTRARSAAEDATRPTIDPATVIGWGVDADVENDPTWPMRDRSKDDGPGLNWDRPPLQEPDVEILQSVEHERLPAALGTSTPPRGLSGVVRRQAFAFSESQWGHWLLLMLADRIDSVEGVLQDLGRGRLPNPLVEMGLVKASRSRESALVTAAVAGAGLLAVTWWIRRSLNGRRD
jgi:hypothetical protein